MMGLQIWVALVKDRGYDPNNPAWQRPLLTREEVDGAIPGGVCSRFYRNVDQLTAKGVSF